MASGGTRSTRPHSHRQTFLEALDLKLRKGKRGKAQRQRPGPASNDIMARQRIGGSRSKQTSQSRPITPAGRSRPSAYQMLWNVDVHSFLNGGHSSRRRLGPLCATIEVTKHVSKGHLSSSGLMQHKKSAGRCRRLSLMKTGSVPREEPEPPAHLT